MHYWKKNEMVISTNTDKEYDNWIMKTILRLDI